MAKNDKKKVPDKKENDMPEISYQQEVKKHGFHLSVKEIEAEEHKVYINELKKKIEILEKEKIENNSTIAFLYNNEKTIKNLMDTVNNFEKQKQALHEEIKLKEKLCLEEKNSIKKNYEDLIAQLKTNIDYLNTKLETLGNLERVNESQKKLIKEQQDQIILKEKKAEDKFDKIKLKHGIKFSDLKKKMMEHIEDTQKNVEQLNISHMDISTKLALLQNHQLLIELEYQSQQVEELTKKKEILEKRIFELERDIEIHKEVENVLADKNKKYLNNLKTLKSEKEANVLQTNTINHQNPFEEQHTNSPQNVNNHVSNTINVTYNSLDTSSNLKVFNSNMREFVIVSNLEKKIHKLEKELERKKTDYNIIKDNYEILGEKITNHEKKYLNIFNLFKEGLEKLTNDDDFNNIPEVQINLNEIKNSDFSNLSSDKKLSVLLIFIKYLLPLINQNDLVSNDNNKINNLLQVQLKFNNNKNIQTSDSFSKKHIQSNRSQSIIGPNISSNRIKTLELPRIKNSVDKRFQIPKYASVLI